MFETTLEKRILYHQQLLLAAHTSSPRIKKGSVGVARPQTKGTRAVAMSHEVTHFMEGRPDIPTRKRCRPRSPVLNEEMTGCALG
jgi:hypothetical protein